MRSITLVLSLVLFSLTGCLWGSGHARTKTVYRHDNGIYPATETSIEQTYAGNTFGASVPMMVGGYGYDPTTGTVLGQNGNGGGGSSFCVQYPDRCASNVTVQMPQSSFVMMGGYGSMQVASGGAPQVVPAGNAGTYAPSAEQQVDVDEMQARLVELEKRAAVIAPALLEQLRLQCQLIVDQPSLIKDEAKRAHLVQSCTVQIANK